MNDRHIVSSNFGKALAIDDSYIAVGDPKANRVAIYSYDKAKDKRSNYISQKT